MILGYGLILLGILISLFTHRPSLTVIGILLLVVIEILWSKRNANSTKS